MKMIIIHVCIRAYYTYVWTAAIVTIHRLVMRTDPSRDLGTTLGSLGTDGEKTLLLSTRCSLGVTDMDVLPDAENLRQKATVWMIPFIQCPE